MLVAICVCGLAVVAKSWLRPAPPRDPWRWGWALDAGITVALLALGWFRVRALQLATNPESLPYGVDFRDYLGYVLAFLEPALSQADNFRYPMFAWLAAQLCRLQDVAPATGAMWVSLGSSAVLPAAIYLLGRQIAPRALAAVAGFWVLQLNPMMQTLGMPSDYIFCSVVQVLMLAAGVWALRRGGWWRFLIFGVASAAMMGATAKGFLLVLPALGFVVLYAAVAVYRGQRHAWSFPLIWLAPLVLLWAVYSQHDARYFSLEFQTWNVRQSDLVARTGRDLPMPEGLGWGPRGQAESMGYWRVGDARSLVALPKVVRFFLQAPGDAPFRGELVGSNRRGLQEIIDSQRLWFLWLMIPGCLGVAAARRRPGDDSGGEGRFAWLIGVIFGAGFLGSLLASQWYGVFSLTYNFRYLQPLVVCLPLLVFAGAATLVTLARRPGSRRGELLWLPVAVLAVVVLQGAGPLGLEQAVRNGDKRHVDMPPLAQLVELAEQLGPGDGVADTTWRHLAWYLLWEQDVPLVAVGTMDFVRNQVQVDAQGVPWERRFFLQDCGRSDTDHSTDWPFGNFEQAVAAHPERFSRLNPCVVEDLRPDLPLQVGSGS